MQPNVCSLATCISSNFSRAKLMLLTRKTEDLAGMARKTERNRNETEYLKQEMSTLREISAQVSYPPFLVRLCCLCFKV